MSNASVLYIVGTPIGNLQDMTFRAVDILKNCDLILAEDTRHSTYLMQKFLIQTPLKSYHQHNEQARTEEILALLKQDKKIALITDAGMPVISDPGYVLIKAALENNIKVSVVPGPTAVTSAISISGINCAQFCFLGFLDSKKSARIKSLEQCKSQFNNLSIVLYEAPHRLLKLLYDIDTVYGSNTIISVVKEITKSYEKVYYGPVGTILNELSKLESIKGEYVVIISGLQITQNDSTLAISDIELLKKLSLFKKEGVSAKSAAKILADLFSINRKHLYNLAIKAYTEK